MKRILFVLLMMTCSVSWAGRIFFNIDEENGEYHFIDKEKINRQGSFAAMWEMIRFTQIQKDDWGNYDQIILLQRYDCINEKSLVLDLKFKKNSNLVFSAELENAKWKFPQPGTKGYALLEIACGKK